MQGAGDLSAARVRRYQQGSCRTRIGKCERHCAAISNGGCLFVELRRAGRSTPNQSRLVQQHRNGTERLASWGRSAALRINGRKVHLVAPVQGQMTIRLGMVLEEWHPVKE